MIFSVVKYNLFMRKRRNKVSHARITFKVLDLPPTTPIIRWGAIAPNMS